MNGVFGRTVADCGREESDLGDAVVGASPGIFVQCRPISPHWH